MIFLSGLALGIAVGLVVAEIPGSADDKSMWVTVAAIVSVILGGFAI